MAAGLGHRLDVMAQESVCEKDTEIQVGKTQMLRDSGAGDCRSSRRGPTWLSIVALAGSAEAEITTIKLGTQSQPLEVHEGEGGQISKGVQRLNTVPAFRSSGP